MAPSTPPPPSRLRLAALTMASTSSVVMSATRTCSRALPASAVTRGSAGGIFRVGLYRNIHRAAGSNSIVMRGEEPLRCLAAELMQRLEEFVVVIQSAGRIGGDRLFFQHNAMQPQPACSAARLFLS